MIAIMDITNLLSLQSSYGNDLTDPQKCISIYNQLLEQKELILSQLRIDNEDVPIGSLINGTKKTCSKLEDVCREANNTRSRIENDLDSIDEVRKNFQRLFDKLNSLKTMRHYIKVVQKLEYFNVELEHEFKHKEYEKCVTLFANLCEINWNLRKLGPSYLKQIFNEVQKYWNNVLETEFSKEFRELLQIIKWPFVTSNLDPQPPPQNAIDKLKLLTEYLLQIEIPSENEDEDLLTPLIDISHLSTPTYLLIQPLRKRFLYHFYGSRQTNRSDKPEWYFTQILTWIRDHREFVISYIQPVVNKLGHYHIDIEGEFVASLVQLAVEKLQVDIPKAQFDDFTFSHAVDEALSFDKELRSSYDYPLTQAGVLGVLTQAQVFIKWITMEKKFAIDKMDHMLSFSSVEPFSSITTNESNMKITYCADAFMTLLKRITDRYESLPQPGHRLQFLELQLELLDDFRVRLIQIANAEEGYVIESRVPMIANTLFYMENVLMDWGNMLHYLNLYYYKAQLEKVDLTSSILSDINDPLLGYDSHTVFSEILSLYGHMRRDLLSTLSECVVNEVKNKSKSYRKEIWSKMKVDKNIKNLSLTPSACPMFEVIAKRLYQLQKTLADKLFSIVWKSIAQQLDTFFFEDLVLDHRFNESGALQLKYDILRNLCPLFSQFTENPESHFVCLIESINLLNLAKGSALLLREMLVQLETATGVEDTRGKMLKDVGVTNFTPKMAITILNQRTDITVDRLMVD